MRILFVEDHAEFARTVVREFLAEHEVEIAVSVAAARGLLSTRRYDVMLVDHDLPDGVGTEVVAHALAVAAGIDIVAV